VALANAAPAGGQVAAEVADPCGMRAKAIVHGLAVDQQDSLVATSRISGR
jgi:hypothetical protein